MAFISKEDIKKIRTELKQKFPNLKFSVRNYNHCSGVTVTIKSGNIDFMNSVDCTYSRDYIQVNEYHIDRDYTGEAKDVLNNILSTIKGVKTIADRNFGDPSADYADMTYFLNLNIGEWDKPYQLVA